MMSFPVWLTCPMFLPGGLCLWRLCPGGLCPGGLCPGGLCPGVSVQPPRQWPPPPPYSDERAVCILLECFLFCIFKHWDPYFTLHIKGRHQLKNPVKQECILVVCIPSTTVVICWGEWSVCPWGVSAQGVSARHPPPVNRIIDACENITLPQLRCGR